MPKWIFLEKTRKWHVFLLFLIILGTIGYFLYLKNNPKVDQITPIPPAQKNSSYAILAKDSDDDGLKDWEEAIYHTNPNKSDSDGDGTKDGEEVKADRDPLKKGPRDILTPSKETAEEIFSPTNLTHRLALELNTNYLIPHLANPERTEDLEALGQTVVEKALGGPASILNFVSVTEHDITIAKENSTGVYAKYDAGFNAALQRSFERLQKSELVIFSDALQKQDTTVMKEKLTPYVTAYDMLARDLKQITVPPSLVFLHLQYINNTLAQRETVKKIRESEEDIIKAVLAAREYPAYAQQFESLTEKINSELERHGI